MLQCLAPWHILAAELTPVIVLTLKSRRPEIVSILFHILFHVYFTYLLKEQIKRNMFVILTLCRFTRWTHCMLWKVLLIVFVSFLACFWFVFVSFLVRFGLLLVRVLFVFGSFLISFWFVLVCFWFVFGSCFVRFWSVGYQFVEKYFW